MNPIIRHFLPSVIRGVYRYDQDLADLEDEQDFRQFVEGKLRFLPDGAVRRLGAGLAGDFAAAQRQLTLAADLLDSTQVTAQRAKSFFRSYRYFENALVGERLATDAELRDAQNYLEIQFVKKVLAPLLSEEGLRAVAPQQSVGRYLVDFALEGDSKLALEVDGFGKFGTRADLDGFTERQNYITAQGWRVIRFTYAQVMETRGGALRQMLRLLEADTHLRRFLAIQPPSETLPGLQSTAADLSAIDLVNDFYRVQDWFVEASLAGELAVGSALLADGFGLGLPFVATAVSTLYQFLDAVAGVLDVDFVLPPVQVSGPECAGDARLHHLITLTGTDQAGGRVVDTAAVGEHAAAVPTPPCDTGLVTFRSGLSPEAIQQRLEYFTREVFGYPTGTKSFQDRVLKRIFDGENVLGISATGSGKSFCFWLPAILRPGLTLVIAPLRSLMRDQRLTLRSYGIACAEFINSDVDRLDQRRILEEAKLGHVRLLYIAPERLRIKRFLEDLNRLREFVPVNLLVVDEAHCISEWGHDFRPSYLKLPFLRDTLSAGNSELQLVALTATAGPQVEQDMLGILKLRGGDGGDVVRERVADRPPFSYQIIAVKDGVSKDDAYRDVLTKDLPKALGQPSLQALVSLLNERKEKALGIVFCIYADPHGKHSIRDGTAHYLFETMRVLEPSEVHKSRRAGSSKFNMDAFSQGRVRAFSSKPPTLCPRCHSYAYMAKARADSEAYDEPLMDDEDHALNGAQRSLNGVAGRKVCFHCGREFDAADALTPPRWQKLVKDNQVDFKSSSFDILVATKGFGMGIDKSSVRFVVHTSLSSGIEAWYQEVGRAGRDEERAHIVLLVDPPNEQCLAQLGALEIKRPDCSYRGGCPHGRESLCDYGKQHMFIAGSYPGVESDAISSLRMLDRLISAGDGSVGDAVVVNSSNQYLSQDELAIYRLMVLGLVKDYAVTYTRNPQFDVEFTALGLPRRSKDISHLEESMRGRLEEYLSRFPIRTVRTIAQELARCKLEYRPLEEFSTKLRSFRSYGQPSNQAGDAFWLSAYEHLLLLLDHTYKDVVRMRYDMLMNLMAVVTDLRCRRLPVLTHFGEILGESYRCGKCDLCAPSLDFPATRVPPKGSESSAEKKALLETMLAAGSLDLQELRRLASDLADYPTAMYRQARSVLEGDPNSLPALFLAREFSPRNELDGNARRLLRTANERPVSLPDVQDLFATSPRKLKTELLKVLNEADAACDSSEGWKFLAEEASMPAHRGDVHIAAMRECLDFLLVVEEMPADKMQSLNTKSSELEALFHA